MYITDNRLITRERSESAGSRGSSLVLSHLPAHGVHGFLSSLEGMAHTEAICQHLFDRVTGRVTASLPGSRRRDWVPAEHTSRMSVASTRLNFQSQARHDAQRRPSYLRSRLSYRAGFRFLFEEGVHRRRGRSESGIM